MIKRIALYALLFCMISQFSFANAEMSRTDDAVVFLNAVDVLKHINSKESVEEAHQMLAGITSNYNQANMFRTYAAAIIDIYDYLIIESNLDESIGFISNILKNINPVTYERINDYLGNSIANDVLENISFKKDDYLISAPIEFSVLRKLLVNCLFKSLVEVLVYKRDPHQTREELRIAFNILKYGSYK